MQSQTFLVTDNSDLINSNIEAQKNTLNTLKFSLDRSDFNLLKKNDPWEKSIHSYRRQITDRFGGQNVTKAWLKMYEILNNTQVGPYLLRIPDTINCFFNAELPGGFIYAANHFFKNKNKSYDWVVASYLPQNVQGKDFLADTFSLLFKYPQNALVGAIQTNQGRVWSDGDLTNPKVPNILATLAKSRLGPIYFYTADGGFGVEGREDLQEELSLPLIRGEVECGLRSLSLGGVMIIKIFTFFTPQMWTMLVYLMRAFDNYDIFKPQTSGILNSESYFIGIGYRGLTDLDLSIIMRDAKDPNTRYSVPSDSENTYLLNKMISLTNYQINNIKGFLAGNAPKLAVNLNISPLQQKNKL